MFIHLFDFFNNFFFIFFLQLLFTLFLLETFLNLLDQLSFWIVRLILIVLYFDLLNLSFKEVLMHMRYCHIEDIYHEDDADFPVLFFVSLNKSLNGILVTECFQCCQRLIWHRQSSINKKQRQPSAQSNYPVKDHRILQVCKVK